MNNIKKDYLYLQRRTPCTLIYRNTHYAMIRQVINFYRDGFKSMRLGKTLWLVVIVKLVIIFVVIKLLFMPDILSERADGNEADYVSTQIIKKVNNEK